MGDLIERNYALRELDELERYCRKDEDESYSAGIRASINAISRIERIDSVTHAHWIPLRAVSDGLLCGEKCSNCRQIIPHYLKTVMGSLYCPFCGARMDEVTEE